MYIGQFQATQKLYTDQYRPGLSAFPRFSGLTQVTRHQYRCDACGRAFAFPEPAETAFYCPSDACSQVSGEVSIAPRV